MKASITNHDQSDIPKDPRMRSCQGYTEKDYEGHRIQVCMRIPLHHRRRRHHHIHRNTSKKEMDGEPTSSGGRRIEFILGEDGEMDAAGMHEPHPLFTEMEELVQNEWGGVEWKETARWIKFEEDVEEGGDRWSKPHVSTLSLHALFELRGFLLHGTLMLDTDANTLEQLMDLILDTMIGNNVILFSQKEKIKGTLLQRHRHQHECSRINDGLSIIKSLADIGKSHSSSKMEGVHSAPLLAMTKINCDGLSSEMQYGGMLRNHSFSNVNMDHKGNAPFMRKIPAGAEGSSILVGQVDFLEKPISVFVRLSKAVFFSDLTEVNIPSRFIFLLLGPEGCDYHEVGRSMATLMSDQVFHKVAYKAGHREHLLTGIDEFLDAVTVLPPGEWDPSIRIEPPAAIPPEHRKRAGDKLQLQQKEEIFEFDEQKLREESGLSMTGHPFGGLLADIKRKSPWYKSDFKDALAIQCVASWIFLYFACLSPIITFGGLLSEATGKNMAAMESLVSGFVCGIGYGLFSGQPLTILGSTGPVLVFETIVYDFCGDQTWEYLPFRLWIGLWIGLILMILVMIDASALVCYITRFTEENFATLIAFIFIYKAIENVGSIGKKYPINIHHGADSAECLCFPPENFQFLPESDGFVNWTALDKMACKVWNGTWSGQACDDPTYVPDVFLMSVILFAGTFFISIQLKDFKNTPFFSSKVRQYTSDFAVIIAIFSMSAIDNMVGVKTPKLEVPREFKPTLSSRGWLIPFFGNNPIWSAIVAVFPAILGTILIFMDQQITAVIVNRKENKLKKGCGYHLDLFVLSILIVICSLLGIPWFVAATVLSINHVNSLKLESESAAPGEKPQFLGIREQRVTHILIFATIGLSVLITPILRHIPMPVLYGVFLYMGVASLKGLQFFDRLLIIFMPVKYQPDLMFLRQVPLKRVHLFTSIQLGCLILLWVIKSFSKTSILFPLMLVVMIGLRKALDLVFTQRELKILDDVMPEHRKCKEDKLYLRREIEENKNFHHHGSNFPPNEDYFLNIPLNGNENECEDNGWKSANNKSDVYKNVPCALGCDYYEQLATNSVRRKDEEKYFEEDDGNFAIKMAAAAKDKRAKYIPLCTEPPHEETTV